MISNGRFNCVNSVKKNKKQQHKKTKTKNPTFNFPELKNITDLGMGSENKNRKILDFFFLLKGMMPFYIDC